MKKFGFTILLLLLPSVAFAQSVGVGARAQAGWVVLNSDDASADSGIDGQLGFGIGGQLVYEFNDTYGFQGEMGWVRRGAKSSLRLFEIEGATTSIDSEITLDYFEVPILFRIHYRMPGSSFVPKVLVGPYVAGFITGKASGEAFGFRFESDLNSGDDVDPFDAGLVFAIGGDLAASPSVSVTFDLRGQTGLIGIEAEDGDSALFNVAVTANIGLLYGVPL